MLCVETSREPGGFKVTQTKGTMLVADGDDESIATIAGLVGPIGLDVAVARTGAQVLEMVRGALPTVVALDLDIEGPSGYEVCRELRELVGESLPIVFL